MPTSPSECSLGCHNFSLAAVLASIKGRAVTEMTTQPVLAALLMELEASNMYTALGSISGLQNNISSRHLKHLLSNPLELATIGWAGIWVNYRALA